MSEDVRLQSIGSHIVHLPVRVGNRSESRFIFDTGIGLELVSSRLLAQCGGQRTGQTYTGRRMSGQAIPVALARIPSLSVGSLRREDLEVGVLDLDLPPEMRGIEGFLSPRFFGADRFTIRRAAGILAIETEDSVPELPGALATAPMTVRRDGPSVSLFLDLELPNGAPASVEVDTGSDLLILDTRFMAPFGVRDGGEGVSKSEGTDETGYAYTRYVGRVPGRIRVRGAPAVSQADPRVMFTKIIYDGLLGDDFLRSYDVTYDLGRSRLTFATPSR
jgi:hypothetical protein